MLFMLAVALLGPLIARACAVVIGLPLRATGPAGVLAAANSRTNARRLASAITPIVLAVAFSSTLVFLHTSEDRATGHQQNAGMLADHVVTAPGGGGLPADTAARAAALPGVTAAVPVGHTSVLALVGSGSTRELRSDPAQVTSGDLTPVQDLRVRGGSLAALRPGTVAVDRGLAEAAGVRLGDRMDLRLPDGSRATPQVIAVYSRGLGFGEITLPAADLAAHRTAPAPTELLVRGIDPGLSALGGQAADPAGWAGWAGSQSLDRRVGAWANNVMAAVLGGFAALAAANTLAMATLVPMAKALTGESPYIPPLLYGSLAAAAVALTLAATALPTRHAPRRRTA
ncbi:hypothetical protein [Streptomyces sp. G-G2]|uniref:hypothetical protein n=1 Tax=Streptomyces sp. G-G2 TaxID=3046201 RepID=UPI0024B985F5|nr:hypothetical protein [Streptomyces sp. G-G2]MDJ0379823.1 hypothetical protein [Streptomyces sp. G-G2]